jgi:Cu/Zn superoxide dismutase
MASPNAPQENLYACNKMGQSPSSETASATFNMNGVTGTIVLSEGAGGVIVMIRLKGVPPGEHGLHVHQCGDIGGDACKRCGSHFDPHHTHHGGAHGADRHPGDLGNVTADASGDVRAQVLIPRMKLSALYGRSIVLHAGKDDLGRGRGPARSESLKTGNSGARLACAVIGRAGCP